ncbi:MAG TPA: 3-deoxy-manno-octulosonate cytidylyltransferase [Candidatus Competibacteraceae bacterium]|nr:3-deoxy-manno-octulosonate cytidylyltransferase [Candidatus Competibacteraceae bacterium]
MPLRFRVAIPARYASTRLPGKLLLPLAGRPLLEHVHRRALESGAEMVVIATDDERIRVAAEGFGAAVYMTAAEHPSGTDRLAELTECLGWDDDTIVVNLQGDEPLMPPALIRTAAQALVEQPEAGITTLCAPIHEATELFDPNTVKVVRDACGFALYFSRAPIPWHRDRFAGGQRELPEETRYYRHIGLYAYRAAVLRRYPRLASSPAERAESLEQLRALWHGIRIFVAEAASAPPPGVDTAADLERVRAYLASS